MILSRLSLERKRLAYCLLKYGHDAPEVARHEPAHPSIRRYSTDYAGYAVEQPSPASRRAISSNKSFNLHDEAGQDAKENAKLPDAFRTLTISDKGEVRFIGKLSSEACRIWP